MRHIATFIVMVVLGMPASVQAQQKDPCGVDGKKCQCGEGEWKWQYGHTVYQRAGETITYDGPRYPKCRNREECVKKYQDFITNWREAAERERGSAKKNWESAQRFQEKGDVKWHQIAMSNHSVALVRAKQYDMKADSAIPPHCRHDNSQQKLVSEFKEIPTTNTAGNPWIIPLLRTDDNVTAKGATVEYRVDDQTQRALGELSELFQLSLPAPEADSIDSDSEDATNDGFEMTLEQLMEVDVEIPMPPAALVLRRLQDENIAGFDWREWASALNQINWGSAKPGSLGRIRDHCVSQFRFWSYQVGGQAETERQFWGTLCRNLM